MIQDNFKLKILQRFMSKKELENFQESYNACKAATVNNLKSKAVSDVDRNYLKDVIREILTEKKKKRLTIWG